MAIQSPNYTQVPNEILDEWIGKLSKVEFKIIMMICRKTFGWRKESDKISLSQFIGTCGAGRQGVVNALYHLEELDLIEAIRENYKTTDYRIKVVVPKQDQSSLVSVPPSSLVSVPTKETVKKTKQKKRQPISMSLDDILEYIDNNNLNVDGKAFHEHFEAGDWHDSYGNPVLNVKQKLLTYHRNGWMPNKIDSASIIEAQARKYGLIK